jgi:hypothetical protein
MSFFPIMLDCGSPPIISNGRIQIINHETTYGSKAFVECHSKFTSNNRFVKCLATGHWGNAKCLGKDDELIAVVYICQNLLKHKLLYQHVQNF